VKNLLREGSSKYLGTLGQRNLIGLEGKALGFFSNSVKSENFEKFFKTHIGNNK
jgi:hypothetical protein